MCEYTPNCALFDNPYAKGMWERREDASWLVCCAKRDRHPLAALMFWPERGEVLVNRGFNLLRRSVVTGLPAGDATRTHVHAGVTPLSEFSEGEQMWGRCSCGTWSYRPALITRRFFGRNHRGQSVSLATYMSMADE